MTSLLDRVRRALAPHYDVERELGAGGMGTVFLGRDRALDRRVAIKILRPELATAAATERFHREARTLASLRHPNVVPVHQGGEADGLFFYVMDFVEGETLEARLRRGPLSRREAVTLGSDLLAALDAAHTLGIVHRDIKPGNIFLVDGRVLLGDFGISKTLDSDVTPLTRPGGKMGTPGYMPPEQAAGAEVTPRTDIYAVGMVLYEAIAGRKWSIMERPEHGEWSAMGRRPARVLRIALAWEPAERWSSAAAFRQAWQRAYSRPYGRVIAAVAVGAFGIGIGLQAVLRFAADAGRDPEPTPVLTDLSIVPFEAQPSDSSLARDLAWLVYHNLAGRPWLTLTPAGTAFCAPDTVRRRAATLMTEPSELVPARFRATGFMVPLPGSPDSLLVEITVTDSSGKGRFRQLRGSRAEPTVLGTEVALTILNTVRPDMDFPNRGLRGLRSRSPRALQAFLLGEQALRCDDRLGAEAHFAEAVGLDSTFALAIWRLAIARNWLQKPAGVDLTRVYREYSGDLSPLDSMLLEAYIEPSLREKLAKYERIVRRYPQDGYARLFYGDELFHRGPLVGFALEEAIAELDSARILDPLLAFALDHLLWAQIRLRRAEARETLDHLLRVTAKPAGEPSGTMEPGSESLFVPYVPILLGHALLERFLPDSAALGIDRLFGPPVGGSLPILKFAARWGLTLGIPPTELELGRRLAAARGADEAARASGLVAQGLALVHLGRPSAALALFDSAAATLPTAALRAHAAEWRVLPPLLGVYPMDAEEVEAGRRGLRELLGEPRAPDPVQRHAAWALALDAYASGDVAAGRAWHDSLRPPGGEGRGPLAVLLDAWLAAREGQFEGALDMSAVLVGWDSAGRTERPFARSATYLWGAAWADSAGRPEEADRRLGWHMGNDIDGFASGPAQAGEVDWALGSYARLRRGRRALERGDAAAACRHLAELESIWSEGEARLAGLRDEARALAEEACGR